MSSASSNQSFIRDGAGYNEVYPSGHKDPNNPSEERSLSASSSMDEDLGTEKSNGDSSDGLMDVDPPIQSVIGPDGLGSSSYFSYGRSMILFPKSKKHTSKHLGISIKYPTVYPCVYPTNQRSVTTRVLKT